ncbi:hypothetical protein [Polyangium sorediatum]|uniref:Uncharacterized protein n=1 Tax=Polyangium sorediatum TaxID=889274 RepID=A0ABT6NW58_9BACT|nr:hypothetical protein [Polyangium sorediatum]MDI1432362.1 hypothetical protein [Polyangium sorediatum]
MNQTNRFGLLAALLLAALAPACKSTVDSGGGGTGGAGQGGAGATSQGGGGAGGCEDPAQCPQSCPEDGYPLPSGPCLIENERCGFDECGYGTGKVCWGGEWKILVNDPDMCGCGDTSCIDPVECPDLPPVAGGMCGGKYFECTYHDTVCIGRTTKVRCADGEWLVTESNSQCKRECPDTLPVDGTPCDECCTSTQCVYLDASGCPAHITCQNGVWVSSVESCTPTSACATLDASQCSSAQGCRWLAVVDCVYEEGGFPQGCYPVDDCASNADCNGGTCQYTDVNPCPDDSCSTCWAKAVICVP